MAGVDQTRHFAKALDFVLQHEGGYVDHAKDPGGATNLGISLRFLQQGSIRLDLDGDGDTDRDDVRRITVAEARPLYLENFWLPSGAGLLPAALGLAHFDCAVNLGVPRACRLLQKGLNITGAGLAVDGKLGAKTLGAINRTLFDNALPRQVPQLRRLVLKEMLARRGEWYTALDTFPTFGLGWLRRLADCAIASGALL